MTATNSKRSGTVYIVDDDASFLRSLSRLLTALGYAVEAYASAQDFFARPAPDRPGCVVADLQMPDINGLQLQDQLRRSSEPLPVIFLTGQGDIPSTVSAMRSGAEDFLTNCSRCRRTRAGARCPSAAAAYPAARIEPAL